MTSTRFLRGLTGLLVLAWVCTAAVGGTIRDDRLDQQYLDLAAQSPFASVGRVDGTTSSYGFLASGTLIAPDWVLTAAHVVRDATSLSFTLDGVTYPVTSWIANSKFSPGNLGAGYDIGLMRLGTPVTGIAPATRYTGSAELGSLATSVGFGRTGTGLTGDVTGDYRKRAGQNTADAFYPVRRGAPNVILMDFDRPGTASESSYGSTVPVDLEYLIAPGDSGGGLFADLGGGYQLVGVHSFLWGRLDGNPDADYGDVSGDTRVSVFNSWIDNALAGLPTKPGKGHKPAGTAELAGDYLYGTLDAVAVPEPASLTLLALAALASLRRRR